MLELEYVLVYFDWSGNNFSKLNHQKPIENTFISFSNAVSYPRTMVIELRYTSLATLAVLWSQRHVYETHTAISFFNIRCFMLRRSITILIELRRICLRILTFFLHLLTLCFIILCLFELLITLEDVTGTIFVNIS